MHDSPGTVKCHCLAAGTAELEQMASMGKAGGAGNLCCPVGEKLPLEHGSKLGSCKVHPRTFPSLCSLPET